MHLACGREVHAHTARLEAHEQHLGSAVRRSSAIAAWSIAWTGDTAAGKGPQDLIVAQ